MSRELTIRVPDSWTAETVDQLIDVAREKLSYSASTSPAFEQLALVLGAVGDAVGRETEPRGHAPDLDLLGLDDEPYLPVVLGEDDTEEWVERGGRKVFRVVVHRGAVPEGTGSSTSFTVETVDGWGDDQTPALFGRYAGVTIKWDSCMHWCFGESPGHAGGYLHLCGANYLRDHVALVERLYSLAFRYMQKDPLPGEEHPV